MSRRRKSNGVKVDRGKQGVGYGRPTFGRTMVRILGRMALALCTLAMMMGAGPNGVNAAEEQPATSFVAVEPVST